MHVLVHVQVQRRNPLANEASRVFLPVVGETVGSDSVNGLFLFPEASTVVCHLLGTCPRALTRESIRSA